MAFGFGNIVSDITHPTAKGIAGTLLGDPAAGTNGTMGHATTLQGAKGVGNSISKPANQVGRKIDERAAPSHLGSSINYDQANMYTAGLAGNQHIEAGGRNDAVFGGANRANLLQSRANQEAAANAETASTNNLLSQANATYGVGTSPQAQSAEAALNAAQQQGQQDYLASAKTGADTNYQAQLASDRANEARSGGIGGSGQATDQANLLAQYFGNLTQAQQGAQAQGNQFQADVNAQRLGTRQQIMNNQITNASPLAAQIGGLNAQGSGSTLWANILGQGASAGAQSLANNQLAQAAGSGVAA
jgi:hypothetical protein